MTKRYGCTKIYLAGSDRWVDKSELEETYGITDNPQTELSCYYATDERWGEQIWDYAGYYKLFYDSVLGTYFYESGSNFFIPDTGSMSRRFTLEQLLTSIYTMGGITPLREYATSPSNTTADVYRTTDGVKVDAFKYTDPTDGIIKYLVREMSYLSPSGPEWMTESELSLHDYQLYPIPVGKIGTVDFNSMWGRASASDITKWEIPPIADATEDYVIVKSYDNHNLSSSSAEMFIDVTLSEDTIISIFMMNRGEPNYDYPSVYLDDVKKYELKQSQNVWDGECHFLVSSGSHRIKIVYTKDGSVDNEPDCAYAAISSELFDIPEEYAPDDEPQPVPESKTAYMYTSTYQATGQRNITGNSDIGTASTWVIYEPGTNDAIPSDPTKTYTVTGVFAANGTDLGKHSDCELVDSNGYLKLWFKADGETIRVNHITYDVV